MNGHAASVFHPDEMQLLAWKFLDGCASLAEQQQLAGCLTEHEAARAIYLQCVQLHVDLLAQLGRVKSAPSLEKRRAPIVTRPTPPVGVLAVGPLPAMNVPSPF
jgi:hypothetical protein